MIDITWKQIAWAYISVGSALIAVFWPGYIRSHQKRRELEGVSQVADIINILTLVSIWPIVFTVCTYQTVKHFVKLLRNK